MVGHAINVPEMCSSPLNDTKYMEWTRDGSASISIHIDHGLRVPPDKSKKNYGWILESTTIIGDFIEEVFRNLDYYKKNFECIFTHDKRVCERDSFFKFTVPPSRPYIQNKKIYDKTKNISVIMSSNHNSPEYQYRLGCLDRIKSRDRNNIVDVYGRGRQNELPWVYEFNGGRESGKLIGLKDYRFSFAFDNNNYKTIFSDKLTDCFATGTIPIWWGAPDIGDYFDIDGIIVYNEDINLDNLNEDLYMSKMKSVQRNFEIIQDFPASEDYIFLNYIK